MKLIDNAMNPKIACLYKIGNVIYHILSLQLSYIIYTVIYQTMPIICK